MMEMSASLYWLFVALLLAFGFVSILSIGAPFLLLGVTLALLAPYRNKPGVFWPWVAGVLGFITAYVLVTPMFCTTEASVLTRPGSRAPGATYAARTTCTSPLGMSYSGAVPYEPPQWPALLAAFGLSAGAASAARFALKRRDRPGESNTGATTP